MAHEFSNPCIVIAQYYAGILEAPRFETLLKQLAFTVDDYNRAISELEPFIDQVKKADKSKSTKVETAIPKLHRYLMKLSNNEVNKEKGVNDFKFKLDYTDLHLLPGNNHHLLTKSVDVLANVVDFMSESVKSIRTTASTHLKDAPTTDASEVVISKDDSSSTKQQGSSTTKKPVRPSFRDTVQRNKHKKVKQATTKKATLPKPNIQAALKKIRLWIGIGDLDVNEELIRKWAKDWKVHQNDLTVTQITQKSFVAQFQSRLRTFPVPAGVRSGAFKRQGPIVPYSERLGAVRLYVSDVYPGISRDEFLRDVHDCYSNVNTALTEVRELTTVNAANCGKHCPSNRYWVRLVSLTNGSKPERKQINWSAPFKITAWNSWKRPPPRFATSSQSDQSSPNSPVRGTRLVTAGSRLSPHQKWEGSFRESGRR